MVAISALAVCSIWGFAIDSWDHREAKFATAIGLLIGTFGGFALAARFGTAAEAYLGKPLCTVLSVALAVAGVCFLITAGIWIGP